MFTRRQISGCWRDGDRAGRSFLVLQTLENKLEQLVAMCNRLQDENRSYREQEIEWKLERSRLMEKNEVARTRVEAMISRLKNLESDAS